MAIDDVGFYEEDIHCTCGKQHKAGFTNIIGLDPKTGYPIKTPDGWWVCANCMKPALLTMNECDICDKKFRGGKQSFPYAFTCEECEAKLA